MGLKVQKGSRNYRQWLGEHLDTRESMISFVVRDLRQRQKNKIHFKNDTNYSEFMTQIVDTSYLDK